MRNVEVPEWLQGLPLAPEFRPTDTEFADPIAYITKIEKEASSYGICKVIPPFPKPSRKFVYHNLNKSLSKCPELGSDVSLDASSKAAFSGRDSLDGSPNEGDSKAVFTTRSQELGTEKGRRLKGTDGDPLVGAQKQVWQSGEVYTLEQFEGKSRSFSKSQLSMVKEVNPLVIEAMFWEAASEKPIYVEYANDVPGSGFGEPEGVVQCLDRRRKRRRRKRNSFDRSNLGNTDNNPVDTLKIFNESKDSSSENFSNSYVGSAANSLPSDQSLNDPSFSGRKEFQCGSENEGTSGWKLSNSPWNLQLIARSPGSLTRFMPDDIPGVTSPMVYIGMLFSWFAWHVEDHELHSLNYLHTGSPKTWYSVPGHYAFNFEEAIRLNAYGGSTDRFDALSLLVEKTTIMSPEVILSSGIPCFRLVQYPGEFVVTFPRAYHIGFSHGFNCGEAANFGTPRWLDVAKEAAVRRAAMNYLPMLSHQQLLYLLTMSFISRVPRFLLPGVRSSRFKDHQREEREVLVKKAFIEDILNENNLLRFLLHRNSSYRAVLWDAESLPSSSKGSERRNDADIVSTEKECLQNDDPTHEFSEQDDFMNAVGSDLCNDDLSYDFHVESGALPCVACGVLGFPFMAVLQPAEMASCSAFLPDLHDVPIESSLLSDLTQMDMKGGCPPGESSMEDGTIASIHPLLEETPLAAANSSFLIHEHNCSKAVIVEEWNLFDMFLKPQIFCLEHAIEVEGLLSSKGRVNVLVICHSDFLKIKTHAATVAEEVAIPFCFTEIPLENASPADMKLIDISIGAEGQDSAENWTSQMSISLQHLVKAKKSAQFEKIEHLLSISQLFSGEVANPNASSVKWQSRKLRTKRQPQSRHKKHQNSNKSTEIIQYSRRKNRACNETMVSAEGSKAVMEIENTDESPVDTEVTAEPCSLDGPPDSSDGASLGTCGDNGEDNAISSDLVVRSEESSSSAELRSPCEEPFRASSEHEEDAISEKKASKRKREAELQSEDHPHADGFIRSPCEGLRPRARRDSTSLFETAGEEDVPAPKRADKVTDDDSVSHKRKKHTQKGHHECDIEGCTMAFQTKSELLLHKDNRCPVKGCGKRFSSHKNAIQHHRVHGKDRPLKCTWKGCTMSFKWAWARTEHMRVHTGERPYECKVEGCGLTFRFISDFSRHRRKTGHSVNSPSPADR